MSIFETCEFFMILQPSTHSGCVIGVDGSKFDTSLNILSLPMDPRLRMNLGLYQFAADSDEFQTELELYHKEARDCFSVDVDELCEEESSPTAPYADGLMLGFLAAITEALLKKGDPRATAIFASWNRDRIPHKISETTRARLRQQYTRDPTGETLNDYAGDAAASYTFGSGYTWPENLDPFVNPAAPEFDAQLGQWAEDECARGTLNMYSIDEFAQLVQEAYRHIPVSGSPLDVCREFCEFHYFKFDSSCY